MAVPADRLDECRGEGLGGAVREDHARCIPRDTGPLEHLGTVADGGDASWWRKASCTITATFSSLSSSAASGTGRPRLAATCSHGEASTLARFDSCRSWMTSSANLPNSNENAPTMWLCSGGVMLSQNKVACE